MTCIVGLVDNGAVYIGGDAAGSNGYSRTTRRDPKVFQNGAMILGYTSSFRMGQLLRYALKAPDHPDGMADHEYLCTLWIDAVRTCLKSGGYARTENTAEAGGFWLLGYRGHLYQVQADYQVGEASDGFDAVGSGEDFALGVLHYLDGAGMAPKEKLTYALESAAYFSTGVSAPFTILKLSSVTKSVEQQAAEAVTVA